MADCVYLVTELNVPSLRNAQRFISHFKDNTAQTVEVVVNRYDPRRSEFDDERVGKTLGLKPKWKVPNDYAAVNRSCNAGTPLMSEKSPAVGALRSMARTASGRPVAVEKGKKGWSLFG
jgi:Flp pilus assembly CpaE family ATPase